MGAAPVAISPGNAVGPWTIIGPAVVSPSGGAASSALRSAAAGAAQGFAVGGPIGAGIGAIAGAIAGLWASHAARAKGAKTENQNVESALTAWDASMQQIFQAANSSDPAVNITGAQAAGLVQQVYQTWWQAVCPFTKGPGAADTSGCGTNCGQGLNPAGACAGEPYGHKCDKSCTASCCVGCQDLYPSMLEAVNVLSSSTGGTVQVCGVTASSYGVASRGSYTLTYTPPTIAGAASGLLSDLTGGGGGGSSLLLPLALVAGLFFAMR
jgi:hypothetical protein